MNLLSEEIMSQEKSQIQCPNCGEEIDIRDWACK
jgi:predicted RNA-binding Zn-ribbon protein involved in translation (DUF1610 family)